MHTLATKPTTAPEQWGEAPEQSQLDQKAITVKTELTNLLTNDNIKNKETLELFNTVFKKISKILEEINEEKRNKGLQWLAFSLMKCSDDVLWKKLKKLKEREELIVWYMDKLNKIAQVYIRKWYLEEEPFLETLADEDINVLWALFRIHINSLFDFNCG